MASTQLPICLICQKPKQGTLSFRKAPQSLEIVKIVHDVESVELDDVICTECLKETKRKEDELKNNIVKRKGSTPDPNGAGPSDVKRKRVDSSGGEESLFCQFCQEKVGTLGLYKGHLLECSVFKNVRTEHRINRSFISNTGIEIDPCKVVLEQLDSQEKIDRVVVAYDRKRKAIERRIRQKEEKCRAEVKSKELVLKINTIKPACNTENLVAIVGDDRHSQPVRQAIRLEKSPVMSQHQSLAARLKQKFLGTPISDSSNCSEYMILSNVPQHKSIPGLIKVNTQRLPTLPTPNQLILPSASSSSCTTINDTLLRQQLSAKPALQPPKITPATAQRIALLSSKESNSMIVPHALQNSNQPPVIQQDQSPTTTICQTIPLQWPNGNNSGQQNGMIQAGATIQVKYQDPMLSINQRMPIPSPSICTPAHSPGIRPQPRAVSVPLMKPAHSSGELK